MKQKEKKRKELNTMKVTKNKSSFFATKLKALEK